MILMRRVLYFCFALLLVGCGKQLSDLPPTEIPFTPTPSAEDSDPAAATQEVMVQPTQAEEDIPSDPFVAIIRAANPANGEALFIAMNDTGFACANCHNANSDATLVGPGLLDIPNTATTRVEGELPETYLYNSIVTPSEYLVEGFVDNLMPQTYTEIYSEEQIHDIVAYLMTLGTAPTSVVAAPTEVPATEAATETPSGPTEVPTITLTPEPTATVPTSTPTPTPLGGVEQAQVLRLIEAGIPAYGERLYNQPIGDAESCADCHLVDSLDELDGPGLFGIEFKASSEAPDVPAAYTIYTWIVDPEVHGELTENFGSTFGFDQVYDIVAYLTSLDESE